MDRDQVLSEQVKALQADKRILLECLASIESALVDGTMSAPNRINKALRRKRAMAKIYAMNINELAVGTLKVRCNMIDGRYDVLAVVDAPNGKEWQEASDKRFDRRSEALVEVNRLLADA